MVQVVLVKRLPKHTQSVQSRTCGRLEAGEAGSQASLHAGRDQARTRGGQQKRTGAWFSLIILARNQRFLCVLVISPRLK